MAFMAAPLMHNKNILAYSPKPHKNRRARSGSPDSPERHRHKRGSDVGANLLSPGKPLYDKDKKCISHPHINQLEDETEADRRKQRSPKGKRSPCRHPPHHHLYVESGKRSRERRGTTPLGLATHLSPEPVIRKRSMSMTCLDDSRPAETEECRTPLEKIWNRMRKLKIRDIKQPLK